MFEYIDPFTFFVSLGIGIFITYIAAPQSKVIYKYPTLQNAGKVTYVDDAGVCYKYKATQVECPADKSNVQPMKTE